jgi:hypothetical protein
MPCIQAGGQDDVQARHLAYRGHWHWSMTALTGSSKRGGEGGPPTGAWSAVAGPVVDRRGPTEWSSSVERHPVLERKQADGRQKPGSPGSRPASV